MIANYVFDSLPADAFAVRDGVLEECLVEVGEELELTYTRRPSTPGTTATPTSTRCSSTTAPTSATPSSRSRASRSARCGGCARAGDRLLVLAADKAFSTEEALDYREAPQPARHSGAFSLMVNFHALGLYAQRHGGELLHGGDRHAAIDVGALVFGAERARRARPTRMRSRASAPATSRR